MKEVKVEQYSKSIMGKYDVIFSELTEQELLAVKNALELYSVNAKVFWTSQSIHQAIHPIHNALQNALVTYK